MTAALRGGGAGDVTVTGLRYEPVGTGQMGSSYRFHLEYAGDGAAAPAPRTVVVKMGAGDPASRDVVRRGYRNEVGFYARLAASVQIRVPRCWQAAISADSRLFTLVLADAHPARAGSQEAGCDVEQAADAVRNLAGLHAPFWNSALLDAESSWLERSDDAARAFMGELHVAATAEFVERYRTRLEPADADTLRRAAALTYRWQVACESPYSLLHGDYRLDNLLFPADGPGVCAVDWQTLSIGLPARDLAYFLATALPSDERRAHEADLVASYHRRLVELGVTGYSAADCFTDYRRGMLHGPLITVLGCVYATAVRTDSSDRMFLSMARGACAAIRHLDSLELVASGS
ncbi:phosphotransferase [Frankia sp. CNm7]|uniref:Phosphotransferase n=2 Tax=Frankia nepalensis TaxID=1836974 RepID=A0A937ULF9_9ACTN|nr:phosphotransferase [Frankia nepalensis]MBL7514685.1 phosphotransferase [Frankia nepalensis]MBL7519263.1 phosphotransferase [Frankia nepalensis]MBL7625757.1 phosphotransferase [Frankia nepalensis]